MGKRLINSTKRKRIDVADNYNSFVSSPLKTCTMQTRKRQATDTNKYNNFIKIIEKLCLLDEVENDKALEQDSLVLYQKKIFPESFPWYESKVEIPHVPRDIDDLQCVFFADDEEDEDCFPLLSLIRPLSKNTFDFSRKNQILDKNNLLWLGYQNSRFSRALVRRSNEIGVIELLVSLPCSPELENNECEDDISSLRSEVKKAL